MNTIQSQWEKFASMTLPKEASETQRTEMRRAFYAGAYAMLAMMSFEVTEVSDDAGVEIIEGLHQEARLFFEQVGVST